MSYACKITPDAPNGKPSKLFKDIMSRVHDREAAKKLWGFTQTELFKDEFADLLTDENGEVTYEELNRVLSVDSQFDEINKDNSRAISMGLIDNQGRAARFGRTEDAIRRANEFNRESSSRVAVPVNNEDGTASTEVRDSTASNIAQAEEAKANLDLNNALISLLHNVGFDIEFVDDATYNGVFNPLNAKENANSLKTVIRVSKGGKGQEAIPEEVGHLVIAGLKDHQLKKRIDDAFTPDIVKAVLGDKYNAYYNKYKNGKMSVEERLREEAEGKVLAAIMKGQAPQLNQKNEEQLLTVDRSDYTDEFRRLQESSKRFVNGNAPTVFNKGYRRVDDRFRRVLGGLYEELLSRGNRGRNHKWAALTGHENQFLFSKVNSELFHDIFEVNKTYIENGELVDLHTVEEYNNATCYLSNDGLCGFAITLDGNLISVFSLNPSTKKGFLTAIGNYIKTQGAVRLDAFASDKQNLEEIYKNKFGFKVAARMDYDSQYEGDSEIGRNHGNPDVVFMVNNPKSVEERHFDDYDEAVEYQKSVARGRASEQSKNAILKLGRRLWNWSEGMFSQMDERDVDAAITNVQNALQPVADMIRDGSIAPILDREQILKHEEMYDLNEKTEKTLDIVQDGETLLSKKLYILQNTQTAEDTKDLRRTIAKVREDIDNSRYAIGCYRVLTDIGKDVTRLMREAGSMGRLYNNTTDLATISAQADLVSRMRTAVTAYTSYLETLSELPQLVERDEVQFDKDWAKQIADTADQYIKQLNTLKKDIRQYRFAVLKQLVSLYYGDYGKMPEGLSEEEKAKWESVDMVLSQAQNDISWWDTNLFSAGDSRNPLINVLHKIVVDQQAKRNNKINKYCALMQEADAKLRRAGYSNEFIYQTDENGIATGFYAAPVDMARYKREREEFVASLKQDEDMDFYEIQRRINEWEAEHTEEKKVGKPLPDGSYRTEMLPKESIYGVPNFQQGWSQEQKDYYNAIIDMKAEMDLLLPESMRNIYNAPQVRKSTTQMFDKSGRGAIGTLWQKWRQRFSIVDDNPDYGENAKEKVLLDFEGKPIKRVPAYYINMLDDMRDLSTDGTHAMFNYIAMAVNHSEMGQLAGAMRLMQEHAKEDYEVKMTNGGKPIVDMFQAMGRKYVRDYVKTGEGTNTVKAICNYIDRQFFNETKEKLGKAQILGTEKTVDKDSIFNIFMHLSSVGRMGLNVLSGITNITQGKTQILGEAVAGRYFDIKDMAWSEKEYGKLLIDYMGQFNAADRHDKMYMLINQFNASEDFFRDMMDKDFNKSAFKRVLGRGNIYFLNTMGEHYLHTSGMLMTLHHEKVKRQSDGKVVSLYDVIKQVHDENGWHLELDDDIEFLDKNKPFLLKFGFEEGHPAIVKKSDRDKLFIALSQYINKINADMHGGYSEAEKGNANQKAIWRAILQFRQWMFGMYNKLYAGSYYDATMNITREGGYRSLLKFAWGMLHDMKNMSIKMAFEKNRMTREQWANSKVALTNAGMFIMLAIMCSLTAGWKDDDKRGTRMLAYSLNRLKLETGALSIIWPPTFFRNILTLVQSPAAGVRMIEDLSDVFDPLAAFHEVQSGRFKGWNRALKNIYVSTPLYNIQKPIDMKDYNYMFNIFN